jgi:GrpB-like predicted nucleotidyltransferase (UPF0157 family)
MVLDQPIELVPYEPSWPEHAADEIALVEAAIGRWLAGSVEHVGSTAVPGLEAKPTIDLMAPVHDLERARSCFDPLSELGYVPAPHRPFLHWFCKPSPAVRTHHLFLLEPTHPEWQARLAFRDRLRSDPDAARRYVALKRLLAARFPDDREAYTEGKSGFISELTS